MSSPSTRKHAGPSANPSTAPEPSFAERARTLVYLGRIGSLSTYSLKQPGFPFGSVMPYAQDDRGRPIFLISTMAMHTQNLRADSRASLLVAQSDAAEDVLGAARVTLVGDVRPIPTPEVADARKLYLASYENSKYWVDFEDFSFYRMSILDVYYIGGFGVMGWVNATDYEGAKHDPLSDVAVGIIQHMNADHKDALLVLTRVLAGLDAQEVTMTSVDRLGFHVRAKTETGMRGARIAFLREARDATEARKVIVEMVRHARQS